MNGRTITLALLLAAGFAACQQNPTAPPPPAASMTFKQGARYQYESYQTDPSTGQKMAATQRTRTWTLVNTSATLYGRSNVVVYLDSIFAGGTVSVVDSAMLQQASGTNDIYRYASLAPELDFTGTSVINIDLGRQWMREAQLNATTASWFTGEAADTIQVPNLNIPGLMGVKIGVSDTAVGSTQDSVLIGTTKYGATKTTHRLDLGVSVIVNVPIFGVQSIRLKTESLTRTTWTVASLGTIAREEREGRVIDVSGTTVSGVTIPSFTLPVTGYASAMTSVIATGN